MHYYKKYLDLIKKSINSEKTLQTISYSSLKDEFTNFYKNLLDCNPEIIIKDIKPCPFGLKILLMSQSLYDDVGTFSIKRNKKISDHEEFIYFLDIYNKHHINTDLIKIMNHIK